MSGAIFPDRILKKLDEYLHKNDYESARRHLIYWLSEAENSADVRTELLVRNELMGLYRKLGRESEALECANVAMKRIDECGISSQVGAATTYLNCATVYKAFGRASEAVPIFGRARAVYEKELDAGDERLAGLYNNMALALVDVGRYGDARELYERAIGIMRGVENGELEIAITYLNMASAAESELGALVADEMIQSYLDIATELLDGHTSRDGYYAFVCEKCASVFGYYGRFVYEKELYDRSRRIYEGN